VQLGKVILGKGEVIQNLVIALLSGNHILMEDVPGVGKTTLAKSLSADFKRVHFTPDLLPTDILGSSVYSPRDGSFTFKQGPVFTNIPLADEINRASPRTLPGGALHSSSLPSAAYSLYLFGGLCVDGVRICWRKTWAEVLLI
jgi:MoxR-like ATPase